MHTAARHPQPPADPPPAPQRALRVAFVTETYPPELNGVATSAQRVVDGLRRRGHAVQLVRPRQPGDAGREAAPDETLVRGLPIPRYPQLRMGLPAARRLAADWARARPDVVHLATEGPLGWSALRAARAAGLPVTSDFRTQFEAYSAHYGIGWLARPIAGYLRSFHNRCACTMVPTEALRRQLAQAGFQRLQRVPRGVDTTLFAPSWRSPALRASWGAGPSDLVLGCVGRLAPEKNLGLVLQAWRAVRAVQPRAKLVLVGDGPMRAALQAACPEALFAGQRRGTELSVHYASLDLFLFPSLTETFGNVTTEALASGLPVLAFDHAAAAELIEPGRNGQRVPAGDERGFVAAAVALAGDRILRERLALRARSTALALGWDGVVARFEAQLRAATGGLGLPGPSTQGGLAPRPVSAPPPPALCRVTPAGDPACPPFPFP